MEVGNAVEHKCKESESGYPHDGIYRILEFCRMKNPTTRKWLMRLYIAILAHTKTL